MLDTLRRKLSRHALLLGALAAALPLMALLLVQYRWLAELQHASALANEASALNYLDALATRIEYHYRSEAERSLNLPASLFTQNRRYKAAYHFSERPARGASRLFVLDMSQGQPELFLFHEQGPALVPDRESSEARAVLAAAAPWLLRGPGSEPSAGLSVDERDRQRRVILNPILDEGRLVALAGLMLDEQYLARQLLPRLATQALAELDSETQAGQPVPIVTLRDQAGELLHATAPPRHPEDTASVALSFVFKDRRLGLQNLSATPEQLARRNFLLNLGLAGLLALLLAAGVGLALRTASRELKLSRMKSDFVSNVSHELRTPLASIRVFGEFLRMGRVSDPHKVREYGEYIESEGRRLSQLINNILDFSRIESGRKSYDFQPTDVLELVRSVAHTFELRLRHEGFGIELELPSEPLPPLPLDAEAMAQALHNLLDNAVKYSTEHKQVRLRVERTPPWLDICVCDRGIGIEREELRRVFQPFHRVSSGLVHDVKGTGLGLAIVLHIVEAHAGSIRVDSERGQGSTFTIRLPLPQGSQPEAAAPAVGDGAPGRGAAPAEGG